MAKAETEENDVLFVKQISMKTIDYSAKKIRALVDGKKEAVFIARVGGVALGIFSGTSKHGEWHGLKGAFKMETLDAAYKSNTAFLPIGITDNIVKSMQKDGLAEVPFIFDIFVSETEKNASGYAYMCEPVMTSESEKRAKEIFDRISRSTMPKQKALAAPKK